MSHEGKKKIKKEGGTMRQRIERRNNAGMQMV